MQTYVFRRILMMFPTLFGISFAVWLVMALAPGRPGEQKGGMGGEVDMSKDPLKAAQEGEAQRIFRRQFGLDRPKFWNDWYELDAATLREQIRAAQAPIEEVGAEKKREAREQLEDYGNYAVPALIELLQRTEGVEQDHVRYWLARSAVRLPLKQYGKKLTPEEIARYQEWTQENLRIQRWVWPPDAPPEERAPIVRKWVEWYESNKERWIYDTWDKVRITLVDTQFGTYWSRLVQGELGSSHVHKRPVVDLILERLKYSLSLNTVALIIIYLLAVPIGVWSAVHAGSAWDRAVAVVLFMLWSLPNFFVGTLLLTWMATGEPWKIFPDGGFESEQAVKLNTLAHLKDILWHITLPLVCLSYAGLAVLSRYARAGMLDVIRSDFVRTARAKGLSEFTVIVKHVVRNGILPIVTLLGTSLPVLIGGSAVIEYIFNINGMGLLMINSIYQKDFNVVMGVTLIVGVLTMVGILLSDLAYAALDPRISLS